MYKCIHIKKSFNVDRGQEVVKFRVCIREMKIKKNNIKNDEDGQEKKIHHILS